MKIYNLILITCFIMLLFSCGKENPVNNTDPPETYQKVITAERGNLKFEVWSASGDSLMTGYNKIGFKVFENNQPKTSGFVKFFAKMYHFGANNIHATPVEPAYYYNQSMEMFSGYIVMLMPSDSTSSWYAFYNYNDQLFLDSAQYDVGYNPLVKFKIFTDLTTSLSYLITIVSPLEPVNGNNNFKCLLHESYDFISFTQVNSAQMYLYPRLDSLNYSSSNNTNPVYKGGGIYEGNINLDKPGLWKVYDSVYYSNKWITPPGNPPYIVFIIQ